MAMGTSLVALATLAWGGPSASPEAPIYYQAKVLTIEGTGWRSTSFHRLRPVARQGTATIWTADRALAESLARSAKTATVSPKVVACDNSTVAHKQDQFYVSHLERVSDGPVNQASRVAYVPEVATLAEGFQATVSGRRLDQGILASVTLEDTHVVRIETIALPETIKQAEAQAEVDCPVELAQKVIRTVFRGDSGSPDTRIVAQVQVPEIANGRAQGEWLVPNDGVLLVSLGIHTVPGKDGMAVTQERLAIIEFDANPIKPIATESFLPTPIDGCPAEVATFPPSPFVVGEPMPIALANLPQATPPSRSLPASIDVDGKEIELPPLPEALASADLNKIEPGSKFASAQMKVPGPAADAALARTSFDEPAPAAAPAPCPAEVARMPLPEFARRLIERMAEYEMDIDLSGDGRTCHIALRDAKDERPETDPGCPPEPRCDNAKEVDAAAICSALIDRFDLARMKPGQEFDFEIVAGEVMTTKLAGLLMPEAKATATTNSPKDECPACDDCACGSAKAEAKPSDARNPQIKSSTFNLGSALKNPGTTETTMIPLTDKFSLEIKATVVPCPAPKQDQAAERVAYAPKRVEELSKGADRLSRAAEAWHRFWFIDRPSQMAPFPTAAPTQP